MRTDLSRHAGFPLYFDSQTLRIETGDPYQMQRLSRSLGDIREVLYAPEALPADHLAFHLDHLESAPAEQAEILAENDLAFGLTILPLLKVGPEYIKTHGHAHPAASGYSFSLPEIYTQLSGEMWLFLQEHQPGNLAALEECVLIHMRPGDTVLIPPNHAHMQVNLSESEPSVCAGLYSRLFKPEFAFFKQRQGFAYYLLAGVEPCRIERNPHYLDPPPLRLVEQIAGTDFETVDPAQPLWSSLAQEPERYRFLSRAEATARKFEL